MIRKDIYKIDIQNNLYFLVFHKTFNDGFGSAVSLYVNEFEFLKFDCFGETKGHYHIYNNHKNQIIYFTEKSAAEQIIKTVYELSNNIHVFLNKSNRKDIRDFNIDMSNFIIKINDVKNKMLEYEYTFYSSFR
jgi:ankyrin repeat protein